MRQIRGFIEINRWERGRLLWTRKRENLIVSAALPLIASLVGGTTPGNFISAVGFGSGSAAPAIGDADLSGLPAYYKAVASVSFPSPGQAEFTWSLIASTDTNAVGMTVTELGFFANTGAVSLPIWRPSGAAPNMTMYAHVLVPAIPVVSGGSWTGTWTFVA